MLPAIPEPETVYSIGTQYRTRGKFPRLCTVQDILRTYNVRGDLVRVRYVASHPGPLGQTITESDVVATTIALGLVKESSQ